MRPKLYLPQSPYRDSDLRFNFKDVLKETTMKQETPPDEGKGQLAGAVVTIVVFVTVILSSMAEFLGFGGMEWIIIALGSLGIGIALFLCAGR